METEWSSLPKVKIGDIAPQFSLPSQKGEVVALGDFIGKKNVVLYFYPKDETPGCVAEAGSFRDSYREFRELGAEIIGVSSDSVDSHSRFASKCEIPFLLLSDSRGQVRRMYGVGPTLGLIPGRVTYIIDKSGKVLHVFSSQFRPKQHIDEALELLRSIRES
jgi:peroxiredoxin Q/BCP